MLGQPQCCHSSPSQMSVPLLVLEQELQAQKQSSSGLSWQDLLGLVLLQPARKEWMSFLCMF